MLVVETIAKIRLDHLVRGVPIKKIARDLRVSKNTVRKVVRGDETSFSYERKIQPMPKLGPWVALRADRIESLQKKRPQQLLRRDPGTSRARIQSLEIPRHLRQRRVPQHSDRPQRMVLRNPHLQIHIAEQAAAALVRAPHDPLARSRSSRQRITLIPSAPGVFSAAC